MTTAANQVLEKLDLNTNTEASPIGWIDVDRSELSYRGELYPSQWKFKVRPALVHEIQHYSSLDETNPISVSSSIRNMILSNVRIMDGNRVIKSDNIYEHDQLFFLLKIHEFTGGTKTLTIDHVAPCGHRNVFNLVASALRYSELSDKGLEYLTTDGKFIIKTKTLGKFEYKPLTLHDSQRLGDYLIAANRRGDKINQNFTKMYGFLRSDDQETVEEVYQKMVSLKKEQYGFILTMKQKYLDIHAETDLTSTCTECESGIQTQIRFSSGLANIFFDDDIDSELA
jgi:hypothetical protein